MNVKDVMNVPEVIVQPREVHLDPRMAEAANNSLKNAATFQAEGELAKEELELNRYSHFFSS
jgi:hypothetical protein